MGQLIGQDPFLGSPIPSSKPESLRYVLDSPTNLTVPGIDLPSLKPISAKILPRNYEGRNFFQESELSLLEGLNVSRGPTPNRQTDLPLSAMREGWDYIRSRFLVSYLCILRSL